VEETGREQLQHMSDFCGSYQLESAWSAAFM